MNERLDYILSCLSGQWYSWTRLNVIADAFRKAGFGSPNEYLQRLVDTGCIDRSPEDGAAFKLNERGVSLYLNGGFAQQEAVLHEGRVARTFTLIAIAALTVCAMLTAVISQLA